MSEDRPEVFRGHVEECLKHFASTFATQTPKGTRGAMKAKQPAADFCGVNADTISRWMHGTGNLPRGGPFLKLLCFFDSIGYRVIELERMPKLRKNITELIGFGLLTSEQAAGLLAYAKGSTLIQVILGHQGSSKGKERKMWDVWKARREELELKKRRSREHLSQFASRTAHSATAEDRRGASSQHTHVASIMMGLLGLLEGGILENLPDSDLAELRLSVDTVLRLSAHLSTLSSRLIMSEKQKGAGDGR